jgi:transposase
MDDSLATDEIEGMERPAARPEPVRRQGETPKQQNRKAKHITRRTFTAEDKIRIVMEGIRGEDSVSEICRRERLHTTVYYRWLKDFMEAGKRRLRGDVQREAGREEAASLKDETPRGPQSVGGVDWHGQPESAVSPGTVAAGLWRPDIAHAGRA